LNKTQSTIFSVTSSKPNSPQNNQKMDVQAPINPANLFSAKGLVVVITGGGSGT
jgi:hypothetical protein